MLCLRIWAGCCLLIYCYRNTSFDWASLYCIKRNMFLSSKYTDHLVRPAHVYRGKELSRRERMALTEASGVLSQSWGWIWKTSSIFGFLARCPLTSFSFGHLVGTLSGLPPRFKNLNLTVKELRNNAKTVNYFFNE